MRGEGSVGNDVTHILRREDEVGKVTESEGKEGLGLCSWGFEFDHFSASLCPRIDNPWTKSE